MTNVNIITIKLCQYKSRENNINYNILSARISFVFVAKLFSNQHFKNIYIYKFDISYLYQFLYSVII